MTGVYNLEPLPREISPADQIELFSRRLVRRSQITFMLIVLCGFGALGYWAHVTSIDIVTRGTGQVVPELQNQFVQHLEGGIVDEILVEEGQTVKAGDVLLRITDRFSEAEFIRVSQQLVSERANLARLNAETAGEGAVTFPPDLVAEPSQAVQEQTLLFERRQRNLEQRVLVLEDQLKRKALEKREKEANLANTQREFDLMSERVENLRSLAASGANSRNNLLRDQLELQRIRTKMSDLAFKVPQIEAEISEARRRQNEIRLDFLAKANEEKIDAFNRVAELMTTLNAMEDRESRTEVRAPINGKVHRLFQKTVGGVVQGGQNLVQLVPTDSTILIEIAVSPKDRGRVWVDLPAVVKLSAYEFSTYGGIEARVTDISSDILRPDAGSGEPYYRVNLEADTTAFAGREIVPGMAAEVDIITGKRTIADYLLEPIKRIQRNALREP